MKLSFVIPAFNAQTFLPKCIDSILSQSFSDFEVIVIDDGSTDATSEVVARYQAQDRRVRGVRVDNSGQGAARTLGISLALGDYIWFVDSDDWLLPNSLVRITRLLNSGTPDVLVLNFEYSFESSPPQPASLVPTHLAGRYINPTESSGTFGVVSCWNTPPWRLLTRRAHLLEHGIKFASGVFYEDHPFAIHLMLTAKKVFVDAPVSYSYFQRASSTTKVNDKKCFDFIVVRQQCLALFDSFEVNASLGPIVAGYVSPVNFYQAHVSADFKQEFVKKLGEFLPEHQVAQVHKHGTALEKAFLDSIIARDHKQFDSFLSSLVPRRRYNRESLNRFLGRIKQKFKNKIVVVAKSLRNQLVQQQHASAVDTTGQRFLSVGEGTRVEPIMIDVRGAVDDRKYVIVGEHCHVGGTFVFERGLGSVTVGNRSSIGGGCKIICSQDGGIQIGNNVMLSWDCTLTDSNAHSLDPEVRANDAYDWKCGVDSGRTGVYKDWTQVESAPIVLNDKAWLGFEVAVMKGVTIGEGAVIGSRSLVTKDVAPYCVFAGSPAKFVALVPRERWLYSEIVTALQADPNKQQFLKDAYMHSDLVANVHRFRASHEFYHTLGVINSHVKSVKSQQILRILDVGGGNGFASFAFALEGFEATLIEPSDDGISGLGAAKKCVRLLAEERLQVLAGDHPGLKLSERVSFLQAHAESCELSDERYDVVYVRQAIHHFSAPAEAVKRFAKALKPGGLMLFIREHVVFDEADHALFLSGHPLHAYTKGENAYSQTEYEAFIKDADLEHCGTLKFADSPINFFPHDPALVRSLDERTIPGRPYSFVGRKRF